jgi:transforming growth factor-beta-induced protein
MKKILKFQVLAVVLAAFVLSACDSDDDEKEEVVVTNTIVDVAVANDDFSILVKAVTRVGLVDALSSPNASLTVFAPTDAAFSALLTELGASSLDDISDEVLTSVLLYHVLGEQKSEAQLADGYYSTLSAGPSEGLTLSLYKNGSKLNNRAEITATNVMADNGVIHVIDKVILPLSITGHAVANPSFSSLVAAVVKSELDETLASEDVRLTVFAPVNDAFAALLADLNVTLDDLTAEALTPILLYHVIDAVVPSSAVMAGYFPTLATAFDKNVSLGISVDDGVVLNGSSNVVAADVVATNGVIHAIDKVLLQPNIVDVALSNPNFSILVEAIVKAELVEALSGDGPLTVFAPTNAAFEELFATLEVEGIAELDKELLTSVLLSHVVSGNVVSGDLTTSSVPTLNTEKSIAVVVDGGVTLDGDINVVLADVQTKNGVIHVIDGVILP